MDLFSQLPEHLIPHILNFLPAKEAARTSVLSKSWKNAWDSRSRVDLDLNIFRHKNLLQEFMVKTLERYVHQGLGVEWLTISWDWGTFSRDDELAPFKQWIDFAFAAGNNLKHLEVDPDDLRRDLFPLNLRASNTLTILTLKRCKFGNIPESIKFPSLQRLSLRGTPLNSDVIHKTFLSGSPLLRSLYLFECEGLESLKVSGHGSPFLKSLSIYLCHGLRDVEVSGLGCRITKVTVDQCLSLRRVDIQAPNLRNFLFCGCSKSGIPYKCQINLAACDGSLNTLFLDTFELPTDYNYWLQTMVSRFVSLKLLALVNLYSAKKEAIRISSPSLQILNIRRCTSFDEGSVINAPNLRSVVFLDNKYPFYSLPKSNNLWRVQFSYSPLQNQPVNALWLHTLKELFAKTNHLKGVRMAVQFGDKSIYIFHKDFSHLLLCNLIHQLQDPTLKLIFTVDKSSLSNKGMVEFLFEPRWPFQEAIYIASSSGHNKFIKDFYEKVRGWRTTLRCCRNCPPKCWKHGLKHTLKHMEIKSLNLGQHINNINEDQNSINIEGLLQAYQALSYKIARINYSKPT